MKKIVLIFIFLSVAFIANATTHYVDFTNGNDTTGTGAWDAPYQTINKCSTGKTGGDECRVAKEDSHTTLSGNLTWTNGSTSVSTSVDLTGELSAGDYIGKDTSNESWWEISSLNASTITLVYEYWGTSATTTGYKADFYAQASTNDFDIVASGTSDTSRLKITGGWTLSASSTQDGVTFIESSTNYLPDTSFGDRNYTEISNFVFLYTGSHGSAWSYINYSYIHDCQFVDVPLNVGDFNLVEDSIVAGGTGHGVTVTNSAGSGTIYSNCRFYSIGTGLNDNAFYVNYGTIFLDTVYIYNTYDDAIALLNNGGVIGSTIVIDTTTDSGSVGILNTSGWFRGSNIDISNTTSHGILVSNTAKPMYIDDVTFTSIGSQDVYTYVSLNKGSLHPIITISDYDGTANDDRIWFFTGTTSYDAHITRDTTDARSGSCLKFAAKQTDGALNYKIGTYKITSTAADLDLEIYIKDDASFNGNVWLTADINGALVNIRELQTVSTSYVQKTVTIASADLVNNAYANLWITVSGTAGSVFVDDFSATP